jgi:hypothetical protein
MMRLPESITDYANALVDFSEMGAQKALIEMGRLKPYMSLNEANRKYGKALVNRWIKEGLVHIIKDGPRNARIRIDRIEIESVAKACNRATYLTTEERKRLEEERKAKITSTK